MKTRKPFIAFGDAMAMSSKGLAGLNNDLNCDLANRVMGKKCYQDTSKNVSEVDASKGILMKNKKTRISFLSKNIQNLESMPSKLAFSDSLFFTVGELSSDAQGPEVEQETVWNSESEFSKYPGWFNFLVSVGSSIILWALIIAAVIRFF